MNLIISNQFIYGDLDMPLYENPIQVDIRSWEGKTYSTVVLAIFEQLKVGVPLELIGNEDLAMLHNQFQLEKPNLFSWEYLEKGPEAWRVAISRINGKHGSSGCCGACGG